ncbi:MAG: histidine kinase, partial [Pseudomonadota bacterium]
QMRVSFPYYIGRPTWRFLHTVAELVAVRDPDEQPALVDLFKDFFRVFATVYACPYCRHHLNLYVVRNVEIDMYPLEYLLLGPRLGDEAGSADLQVSIEDKLSVITDGPSLRLFLWKLHNTVSASIERTEPWFRRDEHAIYTTRHWPSVGAELARARAFGHNTIPLDRLWRVHLLLKPVSSLATLRNALCHALSRDDGSALTAAIRESHAAVVDLEKAVFDSAFLEQTYSFDPTLEDDPPHLTPEEEAYGRSGMFVEA